MKKGTEHRRKGKLFEKRDNLILEAAQCNIRFHETDTKPSPLLNILGCVNIRNSSLHKRKCGTYLILKPNISDHVPGTHRLSYPKVYVPT